jgi:hypothetical protein
LTIADRYVLGVEGYGQIVLLTRIDLQAQKYDARYINIDLGPSYLVATDDLDALRNLPGAGQGLLNAHGVSTRLAEGVKRRLDVTRSFFPLLPD